MQASCSQADDDYQDPSASELIINIYDAIIE